MLVAPGARLACLAALALVCACSPTDRGAQLPPGAWFEAETGALARVLDRLEHRTDIPLGRDAVALRSRIADCERVRGHDPDGSISAALAAAGCAATPEPALEALRAGSDLAVVLPLGESGRVEIVGQIDADGGARLDAHLRLPDGSALEQLLEPDEAGPGPAVLSGDQTLLHARLRPAAGLDIARLVPEGGQGADLFRLRSRLFSGVVLDGSWELAVYMPTGPTELPPMALAVGVRMREAALAAARDFVNELRRNWPVQEQAHVFDAGTGTCLTDLRVLPGLAPCYLATESALVVAWNPDSMQRALADGSAAAPDGTLVVHLSRFAEADARLARGTPQGVPRLDYAWDRLEARPVRRDGELHVDLRLVVGSAS